MSVKNQMNCLTGAFELTRAIDNVISNTCCVPTMTNQHVCCDKDARSILDVGITSIVALFC